MFTFTADQQMALDFPGNVVVSAGAGSGKTRVLVEKYFRLLVDEHPEWPVDSVVAITFTRKAAAELKSRIIKRVLDELKLETQAGPRKTRLHQLRCDVGAAPIGTIHNFCGRVLKEFSFDAHLNPDFVIVEGAQEGALRMNAALQGISAATADSGGELYEALLALLNVMSASALNGILAGMLAGRASYLKPAREYVTHSVEELFTSLTAFHGEYVAGLRRDLGAEWRIMLRELDRQAQPGKLKDITAAAVDGWPEDPVGNWSVCATILEQVIPGLLTTTGSCRKSEFKKAGFEEYDQIRSNLEELVARHNKTCLDDLTDIDMADLELSRRLARLFLKTVEIYEDLRGGATDEAEAELLDYADLEIVAEKLVSTHPHIQRQIRERYRFLIMDEFQDTSESQWNIVKPLVLDEHGGARSNCLFVVGDKKQGVYGFRDANVTLFAQVQDLVTTSNEEWGSCRGAVSMAANFRTSEVPLGFINRVFEKLLTSDQNVYGVEFEPLTVQNSDCEGRVEFLLAGTGEEVIDPLTGKAVTKNAEEKRQEEATLVAAHVARLIETGEAKPGNVALLFRKRSVFANYELALRERGIPVVTQQGFNLFQQPELADMVAALNAVVYPQKDLVLVHYLRSPVIGFTDDLLLKVSRTPGRSYWDKANRVLAEKRYRLDENWLPLSELELERLSFALGVLQETRALVGMMPPYSVVRQMMDTLGLRVIVKAGYRGEQAVANLDKLLMVARSAEFLSFEDFLEYIKSEGQSDRGTTEAADLTSSDAVKIMTVHAAKGLEFPVVYLPDLNSGTSGTPRMVNGDAQHWMTMRLPRELLPKPSFLMNYFKTMDEKKSEAEERRVFYVAMTRCEQRLVLSANCDKQRAKNTFYSWIQDEFERGKEQQLLFTDEDFAANVQETIAPNSLSGSRRMPGRESRVEAALRAASGLEKLNTKVQSSEILLPTGSVELNPDVLKVFLPLVWSADVDFALQEVETMFAMEFADEFMDEWHVQLRGIGEWLKSAFIDCEDVRFFSQVRLITPHGIKVFTPHITSRAKWGWVMLPGADGREVRRNGERMAMLAAAIPGMPETVLWPQETVTLSGACTT